MKKSRTNDVKAAFMFTTPGIVIFLLVVILPFIYGFISRLLIGMVFPRRSTLWASPTTWRPFGMLNSGNPCC